MEFDNKAWDEMYPPILEGASGIERPSNWKSTGINSGTVDQVKYHWKSPSRPGDKFYGWIRE